MTTIYHNPRCRKSRETLDLILSKGENPKVVEYLKEVPSIKELTELIQLLGITAEELVRKGEEEYKTNFRGKKLTDKEWIVAMVKYPKLIERPIVVKKGKAVIGRPPENVLTIL